jgi:hypothetical protein
MLQLVNKKTGKKGPIIKKDQWDDLKQNPLYKSAFKVVEIESKTTQKTEASTKGEAKEKAKKSTPTKAKKD